MVAKIKHHVTAYNSATLKPLLENIKMRTCKIESICR